MRTTITLDPDVAAAVARLKAERDQGVSQVVNDLVRNGLAAVEERPRFVQTTSDMGPPLIPLDNIGEALDLIEGPGRR
jgi:Ribbon-helix-helix protein, copG family